MPQTCPKTSSPLRPPPSSVSAHAIDPDFSVLEYRREELGRRVELRDARRVGGAFGAVDPQEFDAQRVRDGGGFAGVGGPVHPLHAPRALAVLGVVFGAAEQ